MEVKVTLRNPLDKTDTLDYYIVPNDTQLAQDWITSLEKIVEQNLHLEKNYCFLGFPYSPRTIEFLCEQLNKYVEVINQFNFTDVWENAGLGRYVIFDHYCIDHVRWPAQYGVKPGVRDKKEQARFYVGLNPKDKVMNELHNHFEVLQGTVEHPSKYYELADDNTKYAIRQLNNLCHELENKILSDRKLITNPEWVRPSQITTFFNVERKHLTDEHRQGFLTNGFDRKFGHVYMHWSQIGKTLMEVWRDEEAPDLTETVCEAITHLEYYSGEFDIEWAGDVVNDNSCPWFQEELVRFENWLLKHGLDPRDPKLSLGYLPIAHVDLERSFGTTNMQDIWKQLGNYLDIYAIEVNGKRAVYDYCWSDSDFEQQQKKRLGYEVD